MILVLVRGRQLFGLLIGPVGCGLLLGVVLQRRHLIGRLLFQRHHLIGLLFRRLLIG